MMTSQRVRDEIAREQKPIDSFWWMKKSAIYGHGTFLSPESLGCLLMEQSLQKTDKEKQGLKLGIEEYLSWFFEEARDGLPPKRPTRLPEDGDKCSRPRLLTGEGGNLFESLNLFLDSLPFEYFTVGSQPDPSLVETSWNSDAWNSDAWNSNAWNSNAWNARDDDKSEKDDGCRTLLRLPFPMDVPLSVIEIVESVPLVGHSDSMFPGVGRCEYPVDDVKRQIQDSLAGMLIIDSIEHLINRTFE